MYACILVLSYACVRCMCVYIYDVRVYGLGIYGQMYKYISISISKEVCIPVDVGSEMDVMAGLSVGQLEVLRDILLCQMSKIDRVMRESTQVQEKWKTEEQKRIEWELSYEFYGKQHCWRVALVNTYNDQVDVFNFHWLGTKHTKDGPGKAKLGECIASGFGIFSAQACVNMGIEFLFYKKSPPANMYSCRGVVCDDVMRCFWPVFACVGIIARCQVGNVLHTHRGYVAFFAISRKFKGR